MNKLYIFDIDGTLADCSHRLHYIKNGNHDWRSFFKECVHDTPIKSVIDTLVTLCAGGGTIVFLSGRSDEVRQETEDWIRKHIGLLTNPKVYMRQQGNHEPDEQLKPKLLQQVLKDYPNHQIVGIFDDRKKVVDKWRSMGYRVFQVADGEF